MQKREISLFYSSELFLDYNGIVLRYIWRKVIDSNLANLGFSLAALCSVAEKKDPFSGGQASYLWGLLSPSWESPDLAIFG